MNDEHKSEYAVKSIKVGHLYDATDKFFDTFFEQVNLVPAIQAYKMQKKGIQVPKVYMIPSQLIEVGGRHLLYWKKKLSTSTPLPQPLQQSGYVLPYMDPPYVNDSEPVYAQASYQLGVPKQTKPGPIFVVDEIKTGSKVKFYRVWINGAERYLTENQLKYVSEV